MLLKDSTLTIYEDTLPELYVATSNIEAADYYTKRVLVRKPNDERFLQIKALCAQQKGKIEEEFDIYNKLFASTKKLSYLYQITAFQFSTGQMEQAVKNLAELETKATPKDSVDFAVSENEKQKVPLRAAVYNMKAYMQAQSRDLMGAKKYFEMALKEYPDFVMAKRNLQQLMQGGRQQ
jgi:tetratricopeptide (TPR) repeat protein